MALKMGMVQIYTGDGKGKTTAAVGQGVRAVGSGNRVCMIQFLKSSDTGELKAIKRLEPDFQVFRFEKKRGFFWMLDDKEREKLKQEVQTALGFAREALESGRFDMVILDEIMGVLHNGLLSIQDVRELITAKPDNVEIVMTGRDAPEELVGLADYVSEIKAVKHPMEQGIKARKGIEY